MLEGTTAGGPGVSGWLHFEELSNSNLQITVQASGLPNGTHTFHVHTYGDISNATGLATTGHFVGNCTACRPVGQLQEAGLLNNGLPFTAVDGNASFVFTETVAKLSGTNSIIGRAIIIHGMPGNSAIRVAQCVIGRWYEPLTSPGESCR